MSKFLIDSIYSGDAASPAPTGARAVADAGELYVVTAKVAAAFARATASLYTMISSSPDRAESEGQEILEQLAVVGSELNEADKIDTIGAHYKNIAAIAPRMVEVARLANDAQFFHSRFTFGSRSDGSRNRFAAALEVLDADTRVFSRSAFTRALMAGVSDPQLRTAIDMFARSVGTAIFSGKTIVELDGMSPDGAPHDGKNSVRAAILVTAAAISGDFPVAVKHRKDLYKYTGLLFDAVARSSIRPQ